MLDDCLEDMAANIMLEILLAYTVFASSLNPLKWHSGPAFPNGV